jgi:hypothetical protein
MGSVRALDRTTTVNRFGSLIEFRNAHAFYGSLQREGFQ